MDVDEFLILLKTKNFMPTNKSTRISGEHLATIKLNQFRQCKSSGERQVKIDEFIIHVYNMCSETARNYNLQKNTEKGSLSGETLEVRMNFLIFALQYTLAVELEKDKVAFPYYALQKVLKTYPEHHFVSFFLT